MRAPAFWETDGLLPRLLDPLGRLYAKGGVMRRERADEYRPAVPVICIGNIVAGGAGKTPVAIALARRLQAAGRAPHLITRGHGGTEIGPRAVDPIRHNSARVGDEALLLAEAAPTWVARFRPDGARAAVAMGADLLILDDGFQNGTIAKDLSLVVADGTYGFGNGRVIPAGPCREPPQFGLERADALVVVGDDCAGLARMAERAGLPLLRARLTPAADAPALAGRRVLAFAGIGRPGKFFATVDSCGAERAATRSFDDHHPFTRAEILALLAEADRLDAVLITTAKDRVRIPADLRDRIAALPVDLLWDDPAALTPLFDRIGVVV
jgi:tetraacyldisaccharide 4'-kinase